MTYDSAIPFTLVLILERRKMLWVKMIYIIFYSKGSVAITHAKMAAVALITQTHLHVFALLVFKEHIVKMVKEY
jgi:hypothetical protein